MIGGSLGAQALNRTVPGALALLTTDICPEIRHQTGRKEVEQTKAVYDDHNIVAEVTPFIDDMAAAYKWADLVVCRAGALTISELCMAGLGAILVPYPHAVDDHQTRNASMMTEAGAAWLLPQSDLNPQTLAEMLTPLLKKPDRISVLARAARKLAKPNATESVVTECRKACYG
jgi:UDP-N-acetylglucosamine--N-acetylmuramyl-(pentapeptide) pyrophosphoryl-undecaprenol N-acetylglucosamine transferase